MKDVLIVFVMILVVSGIFFGIDKYLDNANNLNNPAINENDNKEENNKDDEDKIDNQDREDASNNKEENNTSNEKINVVLAYEGKKTHFVDSSVSCNYEDQTNTWHIKIPKLSGNTQNMKKFNEKIYKSKEYVIELLKKDDSGWGTEQISSSATTKYEYSIIDDIVYILMFNSSVSACRSGSVWVDGYYYDLKKDKELTTAEVYKINGITRNDIINLAKQNFGEEYFENYVSEYRDTPIIKKSTDKGLNVYFEGLYNIENIYLKLDK